MNPPTRFDIHLNDPNVDDPFSDRLGPRAEATMRQELMGSWVHIEDYDDLLIRYNELKESMAAINHMSAS